MSGRADREGRFLVEPRCVTGASVRLCAVDDAGLPEEDGVEEVEIVVGATDVVLLMDGGVSLEVEVQGWPMNTDGSARLRAEGELDLTRTWQGTALLGTIRSRRRRHALCRFVGGVGPLPGPLESPT